MRLRLSLLPSLMPGGELAGRDAIASEVATVKAQQLSLSDFAKSLLLPLIDVLFHPRGDMVARPPFIHTSANDVAD